MLLKESWVTSANDPLTNFPLNNLPYGVFSTCDLGKRCGVAIGDMIFDCRAAEEKGFIKVAKSPTFQTQSWNNFMSLGPVVWEKFRTDITKLLSKNFINKTILESIMVSQEQSELHLPFSVTEFTDFWSCKQHAVNAGTILRGPENALPPNWQHMPIGYNGRASSISVSGSKINRPWGQLREASKLNPYYAPSRKFDFELELGAIIGVSSVGPLTVKEADDLIFGYVLLNDWSARDIQAWEGQPLGPFQAKATSTTISPWIVTKEALKPFRCPPPEREVELLNYLKDDGIGLYDIELIVSLTPKDGVANILTETNYREMYFSSAQQISHHTSAGCPMRVGDLLGSGTVSGPLKHQRGSMLELSWGGREPFSLSNGEKRSFLEDFDTVTFQGFSTLNGQKVGFGDCSGTLLPALVDLYKRKTTEH